MYDTTILQKDFSTFVVEVTLTEFTFQRTPLNCSGFNRDSAASETDYYAFQNVVK
jgi:hypothetical protein